MNEIYLPFVMFLSILFGYFLSKVASEELHEISVYLKYSYFITAALALGVASFINLQSSLLCLSAIHSVFLQWSRITGYFIIRLWNTAICCKGITGVFNHRVYQYNDNCKHQLRQKIHKKSICVSLFPYSCTYCLSDKIFMDDIVY